ncbi:MAG: hypothetical protein HOM01_01400, partial [Kordiimonadaceae bacterium]|nr:hypothetical protein [Kordiimonadaceae bacterium]
NLQRIAEVIKRTNADIIGLQEVSNPAMVAELGRLTNMNGVFGPSTEIEPPNLYNLLNIPVPKSQLFYGDAILSKHPFEYIGNISIPSASSSRYQAMCTDIDLSKIYGKGSIIRFITTHFDYLNTIGSNAARKATVEVIENAFFNDPINKPAILTGDFNVTPDSEPIRLLQKNGWVYENLGENYYTIPTENPTKQIDYVLPRPANKWRIIAVEVIDAPVASDHLPVLMTLELISDD